MLTERAHEFLNELERRPRIPRKDAELIIQQQGFPVFDSWLDFHDRYAGYVIQFSNDWAVLGLVHEIPYWLAPNTADIEREANQDVWYVSCADAHPSLGYQLDNKGAFLGPPAADSFDIHIERLALRWQVADKGKAQFRSLLPEDMLSDHFQAMFSDNIKQHLISEACDNHYQVYLSDKYLIEQATNGEFRLGYEFL